MFNLLMFNVDWTSGRVTVPMGRIFEHTDNHISTQYRHEGVPLLERLRLGKDHRCLVPVSSFAEPRGKGRGNQWFASTDDKPMFFAGIEVRGWTNVRKVKEGETTDDLYAFLTCLPNSEVKAIHPKAMPVILTEPEEWDSWMGGIPAAELQRPLPDGSLKLVDNPV